MMTAPARYRTTSLRLARTPPSHRDDQRHTFREGHPDESSRTRTCNHMDSRLNDIDRRNFHNPDDKPGDSTMRHQTLHEPTMRSETDGSAARCGRLHNTFGNKLG